MCDAGLHAIKMAPAIAANLFPNTTKYIKCKLSASPSLEDLEGDEWLAQRRALLEAAVSDYANSSQDSDVEDSSVRPCTLDGPVQWASLPLIMGLR